MKYTTVSNGWINKNEKSNPTNKLPAYTGKVTLEKGCAVSDNLSIALWERNGSYSFKITKNEEE